MPLLGRRSQTDDAREAAYRGWIARQHPLALASLLLSAFSVTHFGTLWVDEIAGIVLGVVTLVQIRRAGVDKRDDVRTGGRWMAWTGIGIGLVSLTCAILVYFVIRR